MFRVGAAKEARRRGGIVKGFVEDECFQFGNINLGRYCEWCGVGKFVESIGQTNVTSSVPMLITVNF